jgi:hypothetical protein
MVSSQKAQQQRQMMQHAVADHDCLVAGINADMDMQAETSPSRRTTSSISVTSRA